MEVPCSCLCCDTPLTMPADVLERMKLPAVFCRGCFDRYDLQTLRKWYVLHRLWQEVQAHGFMIQALQNA